MSNLSPTDPNPDFRAEGLPKDYRFTDFERENLESAAREEKTPEIEAADTVPALPEDRVPAADTDEVGEGRAQSEDTEAGAPPMMNIPLPAWNESLPPRDPLVEPGESSAPKSRYRRLHFHRKFSFNDHPRLVIAGTLLLLLTVVGVSLLAGVYLQFRDRAARYDLTEVQQIENGSLALDREGEILGQIALKDRQIIQLGDMPDHLITALIATEDTRFYSHDGIDPVGILRAALANLKAGGIRQGGSTITQQLSRHSFDLSGKTLNRKLLETLIARRIERAYTKEEILTSYLNRIYLGSGYWGVEAGARGYFGKSARHLTLAEAATICGIIKSPNRLSPFRNPVAAKDARDRTLLRMRELEMISGELYNATVGSELVVVSERDRSLRPDYVLAAVRREVVDILGHYHSLDSLKIYTSVNQKMQQEANSLLDRHLVSLENKGTFPHEPKDSFDRGSGAPGNYLQGAFVAIDNKTGEIVAAVGGRDFEDSEFDRVWSARRKPGTVVTPFLYAAVFEAGLLKPDEMVLDTPMDNRKVMVGGTEGVLGEWGAERLDNDYDGAVPALYALVLGKNGATVRVGRTLGVERFGEFLETLEFSERTTTGYPNSFLGESPVSFLELVRAYSIFPSRGELAPKPALVLRIQNEEGRIIYERAASTTKRVLSEATAKMVDQALQKTFEVSPVRDRSGELPAGFGGKNGGSHGFEDNWFVGYDSRYTWGGWVGFDRPKKIFDNAFSVETVYPVWKAIALSLVSSQGRDGARAALSDTTFETNNDAASPGDSSLDPLICLLTGRRASSFCEQTPVGDLTFPWTPRDSRGICALHSGTDSTRGSTLRPNLSLADPEGSGEFRPVVPRVDIVDGGNPWAGTKTNSQTPPARTP